MNYLEITVTTRADTIEDVAARLTAGGFSDLVLEDQREFEGFLEENRDYWDYIDEDLQEKLQGVLACPAQNQTGASRVRFGDFT